MTTYHGLGALGGDKEDDGDKPEVNEEGEDPEIAEARREAEERRKEKHRKMEEEREEMRQGIRDKVRYLFTADIATRHSSKMFLIAALNNYLWKLLRFHD